jgi:hypothetical protein
MKRIGIFTIAFLITSSLAAQYAEVGASLGFSNYVGELSENRMVMEEFNPLMGIYGKFNATPFLSLKATLAKGTISGSDRNARSASIRYRNLNFRSELLEFSITSEVNLSPFNIRAQKTGVPYIFSGIALSHFNPEAQMNGAWYELQPLRTEGNSYRKTSLAIPLGIGMKFNVSYKLNFGFEIGARKTFTDYLDDVSGEYPDILGLRITNPSSAVFAYRTPEITGTFGKNPVGTERGNPDNNDWYLFGGITLSVNLTDKYGLDFDPKYSMFKDHLKKKDKKVRKNMSLKQRFKKWTQRRQMTPQVKKQVK